MVQILKAGFEVDYMFAFNPGSGSTSVYFDAAKWNGNTKTMEYQGSCNQAGTSAQNSQVDWRCICSKIQLHLHSIIQVVQIQD